MESTKSCLRVVLFLSLLTHTAASANDDGQGSRIRFLLYDVNPGEGFNLRRDVYMRIANLVKVLNERESWILVLPPWGRLYHWKSRDIYQMQVPWSFFFDLPSLNKHVPVIEFTDYLKARSEPVIDEIYYLQNFVEGWRDGKWEERIEERDCISATGYHENGGRWHGWFWGFEDVYGRKFSCLSVQGHAGIMKPFLKRNTTGEGILVLKSETLLHDVYGEKLYWEARRSMVFTKALRDIGDRFRTEELDSTDEKDNTVFDDDWTRMTRNHGEAVGGPYVAVHLRRRDFLYGHSERVPSLLGAANQTRDILKKYDLKTVFVATDAPLSEYNSFEKYLHGYRVWHFVPTKEVKQKFKDGGIAIIDQWICAHGRYFIGTAESTFSFRIQEEREILGFDPDTTFNRFCGDEEERPCEKPSRWTIRY